MTDFPDLQIKHVKDYEDLRRRSSVASDLHMVQKAVKTHTFGEDSGGPIPQIIESHLMAQTRSPIAAESQIKSSSERIVTREEKFTKGSGFNLAESTNRHSVRSVRHESIRQSRDTTPVRRNSRKEIHFTEDYIKSDICNAVNTVIQKFDNIKDKMEKFDNIEYITMKLRTKAKKIKDKSRNLQDIDHRLIHLGTRLSAIDKLDSKTDRISQKIDSVNIHLSKCDFHDKTVDERMALFADDIVVRLGRIEGQDYTLILNKHLTQLDSVHSSIYSIDQRLYD